MAKSKEKAHVSEKKKKLVADLVELMKKKTVMIVNLTGVPSSQFQDISKKLRGKASIKVAKKSLIDFALEHAKNDKLEELVKYVEGNCALLFTDEDAFELSGFLEENKSPAKAKPGQEAPEDIQVEAGPTELMPGPDITTLSSVGLQVKVENGKIAIQEPRVIVEKGKKISDEVASVLIKLDITPFSVGLEPIAAYQEGNIYTDIKINKEERLADLLEKFSRSLAFAVSIDYENPETIGFIIAKASAHESALSHLIKETPAEESKEEKKDKEEKSKENEEKEEVDKSENEKESDEKKEVKEGENSENKSDGESN